MTPITTRSGRTIDVLPLPSIQVEEQLRNASEIDIIFRAITDEYGVTKDDLLSSSRNRELVDARNMAMFLFRNWLCFSLARSARLVKRDHATALHGQKKFYDLIETDKIFRHNYENVTDKIQYYMSLK